MYEKLVFTLPEEYNEIVAEGDDPGYVIKPQAYFRGASQIPGSNFNVGFQIFVKPFFLDRVPHRHPADEYLIFLGGTFPNVFDFDAEIELTIGKIGEDAEVFTITKPTIVRIPANVYHCPLNFKKVNKPVFFQAACMMPMFEVSTILLKAPKKCIITVRFPVNMTKRKNAIPAVNALQKTGEPINFSQKYMI